MTTNTANPAREARDYTGKLCTMPKPANGSLVAAYDDGITELYRTARNRFAVVYGLQMKERLNYSQAAMELGLSLLHAAQCEGMLD